MESKTPTGLNARRRRHCAYRSGRAPLRWRRRSGYPAETGGRGRRNHLHESSQGRGVRAGRVRLSWLHDLSRATALMRSRRRAKEAVVSVEAVVIFRSPTSMAKKHVTSLQTWLGRANRAMPGWRTFSSAQDLAGALPNTTRQRQSE
jgi:hypothetical protein